MMDRHEQARRQRARALSYSAGFFLVFPAVMLATDEVHSINLVNKPYEVKSGVFDGAEWYGLTEKDDPALVEFEHGRRPVYEGVEIVRSVAVRPRRQEPAFKEFIVSPTATPWMRIRFSDFELGEESYIILTSLSDGDWQYFDAYYLDIYSNTSGIFKGDVVELALYVAPQDTGIFVSVSEVLVADPGDFADFDAEPVPPDDGGVASICGDLDDRVPFSDRRVGRLGGATAWLVHNGAALTAGHAGTPDGNIVGRMLEFQVPVSSANGVPNPALLTDQYPVMNVIFFQSNGEGADYNIFSVGPNSCTGLRPHLSQGFFHMTGLVPAKGTTVRVTGYGLDPFPSGTAGPGAHCCPWEDPNECTFACNALSFTQQTDTGSCDDCLVGTAIEHEVDTLGGNSGGPIIWNSLDIAIGIHTDPGCDSFFSDFDNAGTWLGHGVLGALLNVFQGANTTWVNAVTPVAPNLQTGTTLNPMSSVTVAVGIVPNGGQVAIVKGSYPASAGNTFTAGANGKAMTMIAPVGTVTIGN